MIIIEGGGGGLNAGLNKGFLKKLKLKSITRQISIKNAVKVGKFAIPIAASIIPMGGTATKLINSKLGKSIGKVVKSKLVKKGIALSKTKVGKFAVNQVKNGVKQTITPVQTLTPESYKPSTMEVIQAVEKPTTNAYETEMAEPTGEITAVKPVETAEPIGELTAVKPTEKAGAIAPITSPIEPNPKDNTMLYLGGAALLGAGIYFATKNSK